MGGGDDDHGGGPRLVNASILSSVINLANTIIGAGMLGLPYAFAQSGYIFGLFLLTLGACASGLALNLLADSARLAGGRQSSFYSVANAALPRGTFLVDLAVAIKCFGVACSFLVVIGDMMPDASRHLGWDTGMGIERKFWIGMCMIIFVVPLSFLQKMDHLKFTSFLSLGFVVYMVIVVLLYDTVPSLDPCSGHETTDTCVGSTANAIAGVDTLRVLPIFVFGYSCHANLFNINNELKDNTAARMNWVIFFSIALALVTYIFLAVAGYHTYGSFVHSDLLQNYPSDSLLLATSRIFVAIHITFSYPLQVFPFRNSVIALIWGAPRDRLADTTGVVGRHWNTVGEGKDDESSQRHRIAEPSNTPRPYLATMDVSELPVERVASHNGDDNKRNGSSSGTHSRYHSTGSSGSDLENNDAAPFDPDQSATARGSIASQDESGLVHLSPTPTDAANLFPERTPWRIRGVTTFFLCATFTVAMLVTDLGKALAAVGATGSTMLSYILPGLIYTRLFPIWSLKRVAAMTMFIVGCAIVPTCVTMIFVPK